MLLHNKSSKESAEPTYRENRYNGNKNIQTCDSVKFVLKSQHDQSEISLSAYVVPNTGPPRRGAGGQRAPGPKQEGPPT